MKTLKLSLLSIVFILLLVTEGSIAQVSLDWTKNYFDPGTRSQISYDVVTDTAGNVYMTGYQTNGYSLIDMVTVKYNSSGQYLWGKTFNLSSPYTSEIGRSIAIYRNGTKTYLYAAGEVSYSGLVQFIKIIKYDHNGNEKWQKDYDPGIAGVNDKLSKVITDAAGNCYITGNATTDAFVAKYDSSGVAVFTAIVPKPTGYTYASGNDIAVDPAGNIFVTGSGDSSSTRNYFTFKYNSTGVLQWTKIFKSPPGNQSSAKSIKIGASGNIYITGEYYSSSFDYLTIKYNSSTGDTIWTKKYNSPVSGGDFGKLVTLDASENVYVSGITNYTGNGDMATIKYNSSGIQQWAKVYAGPGGYLDTPSDMLTDASGNIYLTFASDLSYFGKYGIIKYNPAGDSLWTKTYDFAVSDFEMPYAMTSDNSGNVIVTGSSGYETNADVGTIKYNSSGIQQWAVKFYGAQITNDAANGIVTDKRGNIYVAGRSRVNSYGNNISIIKYNSAGVQKWVHNRGGGGLYDVHDEAKAIAVDTNGNVYFTGTMYSSAPNYQDIVTGKLDSNGSNIWITVSSGAGAQYGDDIGNAIEIDNSGNVYVAGQSTASNGKPNYTAIKYNSAGVIQWTKYYDGPFNGNDFSNSIAIDASGNVFLTGNSEGAGIGSDIATVKYNSAGVQQWVNRYNGTANSTDAGNSIAIDKGGNAYICGMITQTIGNDVGVVIKYKNDAAGTQRWVSPINLTNTTGAENLVSLKLDTSRTKIYVAGFSYATGLFNTDYTLTKLDSAGAGIWQRTYDQPGSSYDIAYSLALDKNENCYITGITNTTNTDILTVSCNSSGTFNWRQIFSGADNGEDLLSTNNSVAVDLNGNVYVGLSSYDSISGSGITTIKYKQFSHSLYLTALVEGFYNSSSNVMVSDTASVYLRNISSPYNIIDSSKTKLTTSGSGTFNFSNAVDGVNYYIVTKHRNSIETWSASGNAFSSGSLSYNFTTAANKAFGNNMKQVDTSPVRFGIFGGDVNQDGSVDVSDIVNIFNDANNFMSGYVMTDVTGDDFVDATDLIIAYNNSINFVSIVRP